jgi:hypothetical protein
MTHLSAALFSSHMRPLVSHKQVSLGADSVKLTADLQQARAAAAMLYRSLSGPMTGLLRSNINIVSNAGLQPAPHLTAYAASKSTLTRPEALGKISPALLVIGPV